MAELPSSFGFTLTFMDPRSNAQAWLAPTDKDLLAAVGRRDEHAMLILSTRYRRFIIGVAYRVVAEHAVAEDLAQDVLLQLWLKPERYKPTSGKLSTWLTVIARNKAVDWLRRERRNVLLHESTLSTHAPQAAALIQSDAKTKVLAVLHTLPLPQRRAFHLAFLQGHSHAQISALTGERLGTVKTRIRAALQIVRAQLNPARPSTTESGSDAATPKRA